MGNIATITAHLKGKIDHMQPDVCDRTLTIVRSRDGQNYYRQSEQFCRRIFLFHSDLHSSDQPTSTKQVYYAGRSYATFFFLLKDLELGIIHPVINKFHDIEFRIDNLRSTIDQDLKGRASKVSDSISFVWELEEEMSIIEKLRKVGEIPTRIVHNDTKFNNLLFDSTDIPRCVVDLDTVMPGLVHFDYGDAIRTIANKLPEDSDAFEAVGVDMVRYEGFTKGFMQIAGNFLTAKEVKYLPLSSVLMPYMIGVRFLTDYLEGDRYYKIQYEAHNLIRAKNQLSLAAQIKINLPKIEFIFKSLYDNG